MKHLITEELILYIGKRGISSELRRSMETHLLNCEKCNSDLSKLRLEQKIMTRENQIDCQECYNNLLPYIDAELDVVKELLVEEHLEECSRCQATYESLTRLPAWDTYSIPGKEIPQQTRKKIESVVFKALKRKRVKQFVAETKEKVWRGVDDFINEITLILHPIRPEVSFRGDDSSELKVIEHPGGDLQINTGVKNIIVQLTSIFEEDTVQAKTNKDGIVVFKNLKKGDYVSQVNGYQLDEIKVKK